MVLAVYLSAVLLFLAAVVLTDKLLARSRWVDRWIDHIREKGGETDGKIR